MKSYNKTQVDKLWKKCQKRISKEEKKLQKSSTGAYLMNPIHIEDETKTKNKLETKILDINNPLLYACIHVKNGMYKEQKHVLRFKVKYGVDPDIEIDNDPAKEYEGIDEQLDKAIEVVLEQLEDWDELPPVPDYPDKSK